MGDRVVRCPGCGRVVDVSAPEGVTHEIVRDRASDGVEEWTIRIGKAIVHRCRLCADGEWR
jgi:hypothetical protein